MKIYDYNKDYLTYDGTPILPVMGEFHFSRYPKEEWEQALLNMKCGGVEIAATYVFWIHHEEGKREWNFEGNRCLRDFLACCQKVGMKVWLRIGPWAHGECRNGGFPDWLVDMEKKGELKLRVNDEKYLAFVDEFYSKIGEQAEGFMYKDGGPVIGIQIENEYGHCGGPSDRAVGMEHMRTLKELAQKNGLIAPYYSATGWGGAYVPEGFLAVLGGYVDAPWAEHTHELEASENFLFKPFHDDANIGSDFSDGESSFTFDVNKVPYLTAELGGGLQVTAHRRTYPYAKDIEAQTVCMLGAGANLIGYYMYHGGVNPDGKYSTLQESKATGYNNNLPVKSYDFQTCLRENGLPSESFYKLRKYHIFIKSVENILAPAKVYLPSNISEPGSAEDMETLRACMRYNEELDCGFLFINNHQRKRHMTKKCVTKEKNLCFCVNVSAGVSAESYVRNADMCDMIATTQDVVFRNIHIAPDAVLVIPYNLPVKIDGVDIRLRYTNASYLGCFGGIYFFYSDENKDDIYFEWSDNVDHSDAIKLLTIHDAEHLLVDEDGKISMLPDLAFEKAGDVDFIEKQAASMCVGDDNCTGRTSDNNDNKVCITDYCGVDNSGGCGEEGVYHGDGECIREYELSLTYDNKSGHDVAFNGCYFDNTNNDIFLELDFGGDKAELYADGKLIDDWFSNGETWQVALRRYGFPKKLTLKVYPFDDKVYYDLEPKKGCQLADAKIVRVYM